MRSLINKFLWIYEITFSPSNEVLIGNSLAHAWPMAKPFAIHRYYMNLIELPLLQLLRPLVVGLFSLVDDSFSTNINENGAVRGCR